MYKRIIGMLLIASCGMCVTPAMAAGSGWYGEVDLGQSTYDKSAFNDFVLSMPPGWTGKIDNSTTGYRLLATYKFNPYWGIEGGYVKLGQATVENTFSGSQRPVDTGTYIKDEINVKGRQIAGVASYPFSGQWTVFGRLGLVFATVDRSLQSNGPIINGFSFADTEWHTTYGVGVSRAFGSHWNLDVNWDEYLALGNTLTNKYNVRLISLGVQYRF